jgi:hypothetical protein
MVWVARIYMCDIHSRVPSLCSIGAGVCTWARMHATHRQRPKRVSRDATHKQRHRCVSWDAAWKQWPPPNGSLHLPNRYLYSIPLCIVSSKVPLLIPWGQSIWIWRTFIIIAIKITCTCIMWCYRAALNVCGPLLWCFMNAGVPLAWTPIQEGLLIYHRFVHPSTL